MMAENNDFSGATKTCAQCKISKPLQDFNNSKTHKDNKNPYCKECKKSYNSIYYATDAQTQKDRIKARREKEKIKKDNLSAADAVFWQPKPKLSNGKKLNNNTNQ